MPPKGQALATGRRNRLGRAVDGARQLRVRYRRLGGDGHVGAVTRGAQRDGQAEAARATGDEKRFALQTAHVPHSSVCNEPLVCRADAEFTRP
ncbi:hypothetical protein G6F45_014101 [Rhizopus arrhizus]|nr:hypothetical protein G6F45_014101 [Rhizopus arrhizus]